MPHRTYQDISEEQAKQASLGNPPVVNSVSEKETSRSETPPRHSEESETSKELERKIRDLEITSRAKDYFIEQIDADRKKAFEQLVATSRYVGELETQLLQLGGAPRGDRSLPQSAERPHQ